MYFIFFAPNYTADLLDILYSKRDTSASTLLSMYCIYVPFMGLNGITEAFLQGVGDTKAIERQSVWMVGFWTVFVGSSYLFVVLCGWGPVGLVAANAVNMLLRIMFSFQFIRSFFRLDNTVGKLVGPSKRNKLMEYFADQLTAGSLVPGNAVVWSLFGCSFVITFLSMGFSRVVHIAIGVCCLLVVTTLMFLSEKKRFKSFKTM